MFTIVFDNNPGRTDAVTGFGFGTLIRGLERTILFDTGGDKRILATNLRRLGIDPASIDAVVLSHRHGDHTGGLGAVLEPGRNLPVYLPAPAPAHLVERVRVLGGEPHEAEAPVQVCAGARTTGTLTHGGIPEHALAVLTPEGWVVATGCAHPGVADLVDKARSVVGQPIVFVLGGFHLSGAAPSEISAILDRLEAAGVRGAAPCHCSGPAARQLFAERFGSAASLVGVGDVVVPVVVPGL
jgi:7,8-dihydropterin-6-yl-methyl-4-(beta-D-ribofuranosyl)aminobenzene 5'-phosphate synthase